MSFVFAQVVHPYSSMDTATAWKKSGFILSDKSDFAVGDNQLVSLFMLSGHYYAHTRECVCVQNMIVFIFIYLYVCVYVCMRGWFAWILLLYSNDYY